MLLDFLDDSRKRYTILLEERLQAPDGNPGLTMNSQPQRIHEKAEDLYLNNPLSLHDEVHQKIISVT